ncbi:MAG: hypothetical protein NC300_08345 [Bacteroidales bacterium]|nr:hypothetical protein [Clostridium sp.]MCM1204141.1 hypothetical protein [Bacteroidales bacterium]
MKKRRYCLYIFGLLSGCLLCGCSVLEKETKKESEIEIELVSENTEKEKNKENADFSRGDLVTMFEEMNNESVMDFLYNDYNLDGMHEAFVITKEESYKLWYMSAAGCELVKDELTMEEDASAEILNYSTKGYLLLQLKKGNANNTLVYTVDNDNSVIEADISGAGYIWQNEDRQLLLQVPISDRGKKPSYLTYYLHYMLDEGFKEYGAIPISEEQFLEFEGAQDILDKIDETYPEEEITLSFLYRSNHYINLNVIVGTKDGTEYKTMTLKYDTGKVFPLSEELEDGRMETACILEIATFPTAFKHPERQIQQ